MMLMAYLSYITAEVRFFNIELKLPFIFVLGLVIGFYVTELCSLMMLKLVFQLFYLSGILTVFFCGIVMSHYTWHNVTENSRVTTKYVNSVNSFFNFWYPLHLHDNFSLNIIEAVVFPFLFMCRHAFATLSFVSEIFIFLYVGMDALDMEKWRVVSNR